MEVTELLKKPYLNELEAAAITGRAVSTLRKVVRSVGINGEVF